MGNCRITNKFPTVCFILTIGTITIVSVSVFSILVIGAGPKFHVVNAKLTQFNLTTSHNNNNGNILSYNLTLIVDLRSPNTKIGTRYRRIRAAAMYESRRFALITISPFYQGHKNTTVLHPVFHGQASIKFQESELEGFKKDQSHGSFGIRIEFYLDRTLKLCGLKVRQALMVYCPLKLPLVSTYDDGTTTIAVGRFKRNKCYGMGKGANFPKE